MAQSEEYSEVELLNHAKQLASAGLSEFQANHEMCVKSGLFSQKAILEMDTCASSFRSLVRTSATKISAAVTYWIDNFVRFCEIIRDLDHDNALRRLNDLGAEAKQVGRVFEVMAAWARDTAGRLHSAYMDTEREAKSFVEKYKQKEQEAKRLLDQANESLKNDEKSYEAAISEEHHLSKLRLALCWNLIALAVLSGKLKSAEKEVASDRSELDKAKQRASITLENFKAAQSKEKSVEVIADNAAKLVNTLRAMETVSTALAIFWTRKHLMFMAQAQKLIANVNVVPFYVVDKMVDKDAKVWDEAKSELQKYSKEMSALADEFEFQTNAKPVTTKEFKVDQVTIDIPTSVDVSGI